jgi:hypothetical protein
MVLRGRLTSHEEGILACFMHTDGNVHMLQTLVSAIHMHST